MHNQVILDKIPLGLIIFNKLNEIIFANRMGKVYIEKSNNCLLGVIKDIVSKTIENNVSIEKNITYCDKNSLYIWKIKTESVKYPAYQIMVIIQDETVNSKLEQTVLKAEKLAVAGQLAIGSLVEIRNPLTSAKGFCQLIEDNDIQMEYIEIISNELKQIENIINSNTSMLKTSESINSDVMCIRILTCIHKQTCCHKVIMVTDSFNNLVTNIPEEDLNTMINRLIKLLNVWIEGIEENVHIIISGGLSDQFSYLTLNIKVYCDLESGFGKFNQDAIDTMIDKNSKIKLRLINNHAIAVDMHLPVDINSG